jgi:hypothetical protein
MLSGKQREHMGKAKNSIRSEMKAARQIWPGLESSRFRDLRALLVKYKFSVAVGEITRIDDRWYVTHSGLLQLAARRRCQGIRTSLQERLCDPETGRWVFRAVVYRSSQSKGFVGYGDADPSNVSLPVRGAEMRIAETRAVNRALRKAYGIGLCSVEELGAFSAPPAARTASSAAKIPYSPNGNGRTQPRLRDQLCLAIRQFKLDPNLVKRYAADFCGTESLSGASRESVEAFVTHLKKAAEENRDALICKLNSYSVRAEAGT